MRRLLILTLALLVLMPPRLALAHGLEIGYYNLPVPLWLYLFGAAAVVLVSFVLVGLFAGAEPTQGEVPYRYPRFNLLQVRALRVLVTNKPLLLGVRLLSVALFLLVILSGLLGRQDPGSNFAPTFVWITWWVGFVLFTVFVGNVWPLVNPWKILFEWAEVLGRRLGVKGGLELRKPYPAPLGVWPALVLFSVFVWVENVFNGVAIPLNVALFTLLYSTFTWTGMLLFGKNTWLRGGEAFSVFFGIMARFAPTEVRVKRTDLCTKCSGACGTVKGDCVNCYECFGRAAVEDRELNLRPPAVGLARLEPMPRGGLIFIIVALAGVTYDGLSETPLWFRLTTPVPQTLRLVAVPLVFLAVYLGFVKLSQLLVGRNGVRFGRLAAGYAYALVPIAVAYQVAHYYTLLIIQGQAIFYLLSDPFGWGWDLFGTADHEINIGVVSAAIVWYSQVALIVAGHVVAVYLAHLIALRLMWDPRRALRSQFPMLALMIAYTIFGLWILSQPIIVEGQPSEENAAPEPVAAAKLRDEEGSVVGTAEFSKGPDGVTIAVSLRRGQEAVEPGEHGIHIHEKGDVTPDFAAAGEHLNPTGARHGFENAEGPHAGDLGNIVVLPNGSGGYSTMNNRVTLSNGTNAILDEDGSALIITERPDNYKSDPNGNSGNGVAGGIIEKQTP